MSDLKPNELTEAVECYCCGTNKGNPDHKKPSWVKMVFDDGGARWICWACSRSPEMLAVAEYGAKTISATALQWQHRAEAAERSLAEAELEIKDLTIRCMKAESELATRTIERDEQACRADMNEVACERKVAEREKLVAAINEPTKELNAAVERIAKAQELQAEVAAHMLCIMERMEQHAAKQASQDQHEHCEDCNGVLTQCGSPNVDGEPSLDCKVCQLREKLEEYNQDRRKRDAEVLTDLMNYLASPTSCGLLVSVDVLKKIGCRADAIERGEIEVKHE